MVNPRAGDRGTAIVTGASAGLGRAFATALSACGHDIAILDMQSADETEAHIRALGGRSMAVIGDASDPTSVAHLGRVLRESELAPPRVLVNNAGISPYASFDETDLDLWHRILRVNLDSMFLMCQEFLPDLRAHGDGRIVNLSSSVVWDAQARNMSAYATSKAAIVGFTRALAGEVGDAGVTVNCIAPGIVLTPDIRSRVPAERLEVYRGRQAVPVIAEPEDLTSTLLWLVDEGTGLVTGSTVPVNGGRVVL
jgi:3-oxoacyl-[acyl-carrier protein] reductase/(S)-1-phenylethanol dehydrogenase